MNKKVFGYIMCIRRIGVVILLLDVVWCGLRLDIFDKKLNKGFDVGFVGIWECLG